MTPRKREGVGRSCLRTGPGVGIPVLTLTAAILLGGCGANGGSSVGETIRSPGNPGDARPNVEVSFATGEEVLQAVEDSGGRAVLVNVWATWCPPCLEEMPEILRLRRDYRSQGLEVILVSGNFDTQLPEVVRFLEGQGVDFPSFIIGGGDMEFIETLHPGWTGALPASFLFDGTGSLHQFWEGKVTYAKLEKGINRILQHEP